MGNLLLKHHNKVFILLLSDSRQSELHFGTKIKFIVAWGANLRLILDNKGYKFSVFSEIMKNGLTWAIRIQLMAVKKFKYH